MNNLKLVLLIVVSLGLTACSEDNQDVNVEHEYTQVIQNIEGEIKKMNNSLKDIKDPIRQKEIQDRINLQQKLVEDLRQKIANGE